MGAERARNHARRKPHFLRAILRIAACLFDELRSLSLPKDADLAR
jgi:hypothetical protein